MSSPIKPELLAPAGNLAKLRLACDYGADAVYIGGTRFGLRKAADNFSLYEMVKGIDYAHSRNKRVYVVLNGMAHQSDLSTIVTAVEELQGVQPDALIVSDPGVAAIVKDHSDIALHVSTQASVLNWRAAALWKRWGASRVVVGRELSLEECNTIYQKTGLEVETFVHGSMCISHSGKCHISNYFAGRDSNRGGCIQSCRYRYDFDIEDRAYASYLMNARDIMAISLMPEIIRNNIASLKIEGRMKSELYISTAVRCYRRAIDECWAGVECDYAALEAELSGISNRGFTTGNLAAPATADSINDEYAGYNRSTSFMGTVKGWDSQRGLVIEVRENINLGDELECVSPDGGLYPLKVTALTTLNGAPLERVTPNKMVWVATECNPGRGALLRKSLDTVLRMR